MKRKETASATVRLYPSSRRKLKVMAAQRNTTLADIVWRLIEMKKD